MRRVSRFLIAIAVATSVGVAILLAVAQLQWPERPAVFGGEALLERDADVKVDLVECSTVMDPLESQIKQMIEDGRDCTSDDQCQVTIFGCPFGCTSTVNRNAVRQIEAALERYSVLGESCGMCAYQCLQLPPGQAICENNRCAYRAEVPVSFRDLLESVQ